MSAMTRWLAALAMVASLGCNPTAPTPAAPNAPAPVKALVGATLIDGTGAPPIADSVVLIDGARIACAGARSACPVPAGAAIVDLQGRWITPGLVDAHVHFSQTGWADGRPDFLDARDRYPYATVQADLRARPERWFKAYLCSGITAVFDVGGYPWTWDLREAAESNPQAPHVAAAGPLVTHADHVLTRIHPPAEMQFLALDSPEAGRQAVRYLHANRTDAVKIWFLTPPAGKESEIEERVMAVGDEATKLGARLVVHATLVRLAKVAVRAGTDVLVHDVRDPVDDEFIELLKSSGTIYTPTLIVSDGYRNLIAAALTGTPPVIDDPHGCVDDEMRARVRASVELRDKLPPDRPEMTREQGLAAMEKRLEANRVVMFDNLRRLQQAGVTIAMGTDAGNPLTLHGPSVYGQMEAMQAAGLTPMQVLVASTRNGARAMGRESDFGTISAGKHADLLVLAADPAADIKNMRQLRRVWRAGVEVVSRPAQ